MDSNNKKAGVLSLFSDLTATGREINGQPRLWKKTYDLVVSERDGISDFLERISLTKNLQIIITGAGTSAFLAEILVQSFYEKTGIPTRGIPSTDLITHPGDYFQGNTPLLLISIARSGDSPESVGAFELAGKLCQKVYHLVITCNAEGKLAQAARQNGSYIFLMPEKANDQSLAMTGSFTSMLLAGFLISDISNIDLYKDEVLKLSRFGENILNVSERKMKSVAELEYSRVVFLGSGPLKGIAKESQLKVQELSDGKIIGLHDSFLGFRHGPKAIIDKSTLLVYIFSSDPYVFQYEADLVHSINKEENYLFSVGIGQDMKKLQKLNLDVIIDPTIGEEPLPDHLFSICSVMSAQILGYYKSFLLGISPDSPSQNGGISRVVRGVKIYPYV